MSNYLWPHGLWHARLPCPSPAPRICSNSCPVSQWCDQSSHLLLSPSLPAFHLSQHQGLFQWVNSSYQGAKLLVSASASVNIQGWFPLGLTDLIFLLSKGLSGVFSSTTVQKYQFFSMQPSLWSSSHIYTWLLEKPYLWLCGPLLAKLCLCFLKHCLVLS